MVVLLAAAVVAQDADLLGDGVVVGGDQAAVAEAAEVLAREEAVGAGIADAAGHASAVGGAEGLGAVLDDLQTVFLGDRADLVHVGRLAEQVHRQDRARAPGYGGADGLRVDVEAAGQDVHEHRDGAAVADGLGGGDEGEGGGDDLVALADAGGAQGQVQGIGTGGAAEGVTHAKVVGGFLLEGLHIGAEDVAGIGQRLQHGRFDFVFQRLVLTLQVDHRDLHGVTPG